MLASAAPNPSASAVPNPPASAAPPALANPQPPNPPQPLHHPLSSVNRPTRDVRRETTGTGRGLPPSRPRVLVFTSEQCRLTSLSPFQRREGCDRFGKIKRCENCETVESRWSLSTRRRQGKRCRRTHFSFTVKTETGRQETKVPITVTAHRTKNSSQGVVYCTDLEGVSNDDIADGLAECGVSSAPPQGDRPLPAPREAGLLGSSLRRRRPRPVGGVAPPPGPSCFRFCFSVFFAPMRDCRVVWLSVARQCGAAELRSVTWFYLFVVCCVFFRPVVYLFFLVCTGV